MAGTGTGLGVSLASTARIAASTSIEEEDISASLNIITSQDGLHITTESGDILIIN